ncbi:uncharacterized protein [Asterias amurensis]|uniref:uncharacterized protein n=1 Tax=Asterias amurensis TaxID=7602 RepID=UPI003AB7B8A4
MAEGVSTDPLLSKVLLGHLECSICCTRYNQPKNMDCSHSYCLKCLQELKKTQNPDTNKLKCPLCQKETILPLDGVTGLQNNYILIAMVEEVNKHEQLPQGEESKVMCQACDEENAAISRCLNCEHYLCLECQKAHQRFSAMKNHEVKTLAELQEVDETQTESKRNISRCDIHPIQELCLYCMTCEQLTCKLCAVQQHKQPMHNLTDLLTAFEICETEARKDVSQLHKSKLKIAAMRTRLSCLFQETNDHISYHTERKIDKIRREEIRLKQSAKLMYQNKDKKLAKLQFAEETLLPTGSAMTNANRLEILHKYEHDVFVREHQEEELTYDLSFIAFCEVENEVELGTLLNKEKWELMSEVEADAGCLSSYSTGEIVAVSGSQIQILRQFGKDFNIVSQCWCTDISQSTAIAVNNEDHLIVLDNPNVKTLNKEFQLLHQFTPSGTGYSSKPTCLAVDENNLIAVGYYVHRNTDEYFCMGDPELGEVSLHNPDGSLIRTLYSPGTVKNMAMSHQRIIFTAERKLIFVDYEGKQILEPQINECVDGLCCDTAGDIYVLYPKRIQHLSADQGTHLEWIDVNQTKVNKLTFTHKGKLVTGGDRILYIYHRVL